MLNERERERSGAGVADEGVREIFTDYSIDKRAVNWVKL